MLMTYVSYAAVAGGVFILSALISQKLLAKSKVRKSAKKLAVFLAGTGVVTLLGAATAAAAVHTSTGFIL